MGRANWFNTFIFITFLLPGCDYLRDYAQQVKRSSINRLSGTMNASLRAQAANLIAQGMFPDYDSSLDPQPPGTWASEQHPLFSQYLDPPMTYGIWYKIDATCYALDLNRDKKISNDKDLCLYYDRLRGQTGLWEGHNTWCDKRYCTMDTD